MTTDAIAAVHMELCRAAWQATVALRARDVQRAELELAQVEQALRILEGAAAALRHGQPEGAA